VVLNDIVLNVWVIGLATRRL